MEFMFGIPSFVSFGAGISTKLGDIAAVEQVKMLNQALHIPTLSECGVARGKFERLADDALAEISTFFNPREATRQDVLDILESAY